MMTDIHVQRTSDSQFRVDVEERSSRTVHTVTASSEDIQRYGAGAQPEILIQKSFEFLLEREPKESILRSFDLSVIERYFPEYPKSIRSRLG